MDIFNKIREEMEKFELNKMKIDSYATSLSNEVEHLQTEISNIEKYNKDIINTYALLLSKEIERLEVETSNIEKYNKDIIGEIGFVTNKINSLNELIKINQEIYIQNNKSFEMILLEIKKNMKNMDEILIGLQEKLNVINRIEATNEFYHKQHKNRFLIIFLIGIFNIVLMCIIMIMLVMK